MLFGVYAEKEKKRVSQAGAMAEPKTENLQLQAVASAKGIITPKSTMKNEAGKTVNAFAPTIRLISSITNDFDKASSKPEYSEVLKRRVDIV